MSAPTKLPNGIVQMEPSKKPRNSNRIAPQKAFDATAAPVINPAILAATTLKYTCVPKPA
jgi:hypothetical protein